MGRWLVLTWWVTLLPYGIVGDASAASYTNPPVNSNGDRYLLVCLCNCSLVRPFRNDTGKWQNKM